MTVQKIGKFWNDAVSTLQVKRYKPITSLKVAYVAAIGSLILLSLNSHFILKKQIYESTSNVRVINAAAFLRTGVQRTALLARNLINSTGLTERENIRKEIRFEADRLETVMAGLLGGDSRLGLPDKHSEEIRKMLFEPPVQLGERMTQFIRETRRLVGEKDTLLGASNPHMKYIRKEASGEHFSTDFETLIRVYQAESQRRLEELRDIERIIVFFQVLVLLLMAAFIFKPLVERVEREINVLNQTNTTLERRVAERTAMAHEHEIKLQESERLALMDPLTEVLNRRGLEVTLRRLRISGEADEGSVLLVDLDDFKLINDRFGHAVGDRVMKEVASVMRASLRQEDCISRIGGDEFLILLPRVSSIAASQVAEKIRSRVESAEIYAHPLERLPIRVSIGMGSFAGVEQTIDSLLKATHLALQQSKLAGKNRVTVETSLPRLKQGFA